MALLVRFVEDDEPAGLRGWGAGIFGRFYLTIGAAVAGAFVCF
jgi:hypothetical protein